MSESSDDTWLIWWWAVVPFLILGLLYCAMAATLWPYARPLFPIWLLVFALFFPPLFPFVFFYALAISLVFPRPYFIRPVPVTPASVTVVVDDGNKKKTAVAKSSAKK